MQRFLAFLLFITIVQTQTLVINAVEEGTLIEKIEKTLIEDVLRLLSKRKGKKISFRWQNHNTFKDLIDFSKRTDVDKNLHFSLSSITITEERKKYLDFSYPYVPTREVLICKMHRGHNLEHQINNSKIGYNSGTIQDLSVKHFKRKYKFKAIDYKTHAVKEDDLLHGRLDFMIGDNINVWNDSRMHIVFDLEYQSGQGFGIAYFKGSKLKNEIDPILKYYLRSAKFRKLTSEHFGDDISDYFAKVLFTAK